MARKPFSPSPGFTLIELLIVVAIIAILAAIAVPNFLEAQTRSKVSRIEADFRSLSTALEAYAVDYNNYPHAPSWQRSEEGLALLTTPVSYMTSIPDDVFRDETIVFFLQDVGVGTAANPIFDTSQPVYQSRAGNACPVCFGWDYGRFTMLEEAWDIWPNGSLSQADAAWFPFERGYQLRSMGPDREDSFIVPYDPTNGTISDGDLGRWGPTNESTASR